jgi:hypothetical protein
MNRVAEVNRELARRGEQPRLRRGRGYYYFSGAQAASWPSSGVMVNRADQLTVDEWLEAYEQLKEATTT